MTWPSLLIIPLPLKIVLTVKEFGKKKELLKYSELNYNINIITKHQIKRR